MRCKHGRSIHFNWDECDLCRQEQLEEDRQWEMLELQRRQTEALERRERERRTTKKKAASSVTSGPSQSACECCGQLFVENTRVRPAIGKAWTGPLARFVERGICPRCHMDYGQLEGFEKDWSRDEWNRHHEARVRAAASPDAARQLARELGADWPQLAERAAKRAEELATAADQKARAVCKERVFSESSPEALRKLAREARERWPGTELAEKAEARAEEIERSAIGADIGKARDPARLRALAEKAQGRWPDLAKRASERARERESEIEAERREQTRSSIRSATATSAVERLRDTAKAAGWADVAAEAESKRAALAAEQERTRRHTTARAIEDATTVARAKALRDECKAAGWGDLEQIAARRQSGLAAVDRAEQQRREQEQERRRLAVARAEARAEARRRAEVAAETTGSVIAGIFLGAFWGLIPSAIIAGVAGNWGVFMAGLIISAGIGAIAKGASSGSSSYSGY